MLLVDKCVSTKLNINDKASVGVVVGEKRNQQHVVKDSYGFAMNGGKFAETMKIEENKLPVPNKENYVFAGWYTDETLTTPLGDNVPTAEGTYYAKWASKITFDSKNGDEITTMEVAEGTAIGTLSTEPTRNGYIFKGWYTTETGGDEVTVDTVPTGSTTYYAQWEGVPYTINFDLNGGTGTTPQALTMEFGTEGTLPTDAGFKNTGYTFVEWNKAKDGAGTGYDAGGAINLSDVEENDTITLYAIWGNCDHEDSDDKSTCTSTAVCSLCGGTISLKDHVYNSEWSKDESNHWYACSNADCSSVKDTAAHSYATDCDADCDVCGYEREVVEEHAYIWTSNGNGTHSGSCGCDAAVTADCTYGEDDKCTVCGYAKPVSTSSSSGFTGSYNYPVSTPTVDNCDIKMSDSNAVEGESVTATVTPDNGYGVAEVIVTDEDGNIIPVEFIGNGQYTFVMPDGEVDIEVICKPAITMSIGDTMLNIFGKIVKNDVAPTIGEGNRTMLPIRAIANALGADVYWDADNQKVTIVKDGKVIEVFIGKDYAFVDGERIQLDAKAYIENSRTYLQLRFVTEALDAEVIWDPVKRMITIIPE